ncbi:MAG: carotenoid cleavage dioxygenase [Acidimicrobiales bacterium]|nr:carotenoid cleavage dioxygenase [Acidimicrobiales bacterium]
MTATDPITNPYLSGPYAPVHEEVTAFGLEVDGLLPRELDGRYLRIGPNPIQDVDPATYHWFTGDGMVHGVRLRDGQAEWYRNRWVRSTNVSQALGEEPAPGERHGGFDGANTNVIGHAGRTFAIVEAGSRPVELDDELDTICHSDFDGTLPHGFTAHPKRDPLTGELHAMSYYWGRPNVIEYVVVGTDGRVRRRVDIDVPGGPMVHDMSLTERHVVAYDLPCTFNLELAMSGTSFPYCWDADYGARVGVLAHEADPSTVRWFEVDPCYVFHPMNSYDDGDRVVLDVVRHPKMFDRERLGPNDGPPSLWRWTLDLASGTTKEEQLDDRPIEFPRVDERLVGRAHRWGWATGMGPSAGGAGFDAQRLVRYDRQTGATEIHEFGPGRAVGEAVFVPREDAAAEDDGWFLVLVLDPDAGRTDLVVLAAQDFTGAPVATVHLPARVPIGFHGNWVPTATSASPGPSTPAR